MPYVEVAGQQLYLEDSGGDGPPIVLSHGDGADHGQFAHQVADLSDVYRVVTWVQRKNMGTAPDALPTSAECGSGDLFALMDVLGIERVVLGGRDLGADLSLRAALAHPDRVRALILIDTPKSAADELDHRIAELAMPVLLVAGSDSLAHSPPRRLADDLGDCRGVVELDGDFDSVNVERPNEVNSPIRGFLESLPA